MFLKIVTKWLEIQKTNLSLIIIYGQLSFPPKIFFTLLQIFCRLVRIKNGLFGTLS